MKLLSKLKPEQADLIREWCRQQPLKEETKSSYVKGRKEAWYFHASNLQSITMGRGKVWEAPVPEGDAAPLICEIGDATLPGWNSLLVCGGPTSIKWHRDHGHFFGPAVMINLGEAIYLEAKARHENPTAATPEMMHKLNDGDIVLIDTKFLHASEQISKERFNLTFRTIKPEYL